MAKGAAERAARLTVGESLLVMWDFQNPNDSDALALRTSGIAPGDVHLLGYCPRYLRGEILRLMTTPDRAPSVTVARVNVGPAPIQFRVMCHLRMEWAGEFEPFSEPEYQPIVRVESKSGALHVA